MASFGDKDLLFSLRQNTKAQMKPKYIRDKNRAVMSEREKGDFLIPVRTLMHVARSEDSLTTVPD